MAGTGDGEGQGAISKLENHIIIIKYTLFATNILIWMIGASIFALALWLRMDEGIRDWLDILDSNQFYNGVYVLIVAAIIIMIVSFLGCLSALQENEKSLLVYSGTQILSFIFELAGAAVLLDNSTRNSNLQYSIRESMRRLIMNAHHEESRQTLAMIQENIGCCGADGARDYMTLHQPLPIQCRDTVTGNAFYHGCVDELTWFFEEKCGWVAGLAMTACLINVINVVLAIVLKQAVEKEQDQQQHN